MDTRTLAWSLALAALWTAPAHSDPLDKRTLVSNLAVALNYDTETAIHALEAVAVLGPQAKPAVPVLKVALNHPSFLVRQRALEVLGGLGREAKETAPEVAQLLWDASYEVQVAAEKTLLQFGAPVLPYLAKALKQSPAAIRKKLVGLLTQFGRGATPILVATLERDEDRIVRITAAEGLATVQPVTEEVVPALMEILKEPDDGMRLAAIQSLGQLGQHATPAIGKLIRISNTDKDALLRERSRQAAREIGSGKNNALAGLLKALDSSQIAKRL